MGKKKKNNNNNNVAQFTCYTCKVPQQFPNKNSLESHNKNVHKKCQLLCEKCSSAFRYPTDLDDHEKKIHASTSLIVHTPLCGAWKVKDSIFRPKSAENYRIHFTGLVGRSILLTPCLPGERFERRVVYMGSVKAAMELTKEAYSHKEKGRISRTWKYRIDDDSDLENQVWLAFSQEEGRASPQAFILKRIEGMKNKQAISEVLSWSRDPAQMRRLASRKEEIYQSLQGGVYNLRPGSREFVDVLMTYKIPMALVSTRPRKSLENAIGAIGMEGVFSVVVAGEDVHRGKPDPEMFIYAAQLLNFIPERCIVFGNSIQTVEAAHGARMKCVDRVAVAVASRHPVYELGAADLVVRHLDELSTVDLKNPAVVESPEFQTPEIEVEMEKEEYRHEPKSTGVDDFF